MTAVTDKITNSTASKIAIKWRHGHNYGEGNINGNRCNDVCTIGDGTNDSCDDMEVESESCSLAGGAPTAVTFFHMADLAGKFAKLKSNTQSVFDVSCADETLVQGTPSGLVAANWGLTRTMTTTNTPEASVPWDLTETMTWTLVNEPVAGLQSVGGNPYLDADGNSILMGEPEADGGWCAYEGWNIIVNYYDGGAHLNCSPALGAADCSEAAALADTGVDAQSIGLVGVFALMGGLGAPMAMRRRSARSL